jgi:NADP-dependent 3-hydroxy acid dehydrogenase YdfG
VNGLIENENMSKSLKLAVVTGSSKGIGLATCHLLLKHGYKVAGISRSKTDIINENFKHYSINVGNSKDVSDVFTQITKDFSQEIDILVNNAGLGHSALMHEMSDEKWHEMFDINVHGIFYCSKAVIPGMIKKGAGHIVNISSIAGTNGVETMAGYCGTKHAVRGISHSLYKEVRNHGIKVTCIYPGSVNTHFFDSIDSVIASPNMMRPEDIALSIYNSIETHPNYHIVDIEVRPLKPKG